MYLQAHLSCGLLSSYVLGIRGTCRGRPTTPAMSQMWIACVTGLSSSQAATYRFAHAVHSACLLSPSECCSTEVPDRACLLQGRTDLFQLDNTGQDMPPLNLTAAGSLHELDSSHLPSEARLMERRAHELCSHLKVASLLWLDQGLF